MSQHQRPAPDNKRYSRPPESTSGRFSDPGARGGDWPWRAILMLAVAVPAANRSSNSTRSKTRCVVHQSSAGATPARPCHPASVATGPARPAAAARGPRRAFPSALGWERIAAQALKPIATARRHHDTRMEIEPLLARVPAAHRRRVRHVNSVAPATDRRTGARTERGHARHRRSGQTSQGRCVFGPTVRRVESVAAIRHAAAMQTTPRSVVRWSPTAGRHRHRVDHAHGTTRHHRRRAQTLRPARARECARSGSRLRQSAGQRPPRRRGHPPHRDSWPDDAASRARRADRPRPRPGRACGPTPAGSEDAGAGSGRIDGSGRPGTRDRPGARHDRSCGDRHSSDRTRAPCTRTVLADRAGSPNTGTARTPLPDTRTSGSRETSVQRSAAGPARRAGAPPARRRSRNGRAPIGGGRPARAGAVDRWMRHSTRHQGAQASCPMVERCGINDLRRGRCCRPSPRPA